VLSDEGLEFGYRVAFEVSQYLCVHRAVTPDWQLHDGMDAQILQKLLPRLHGSQRKLEGILAALSYLCYEKRLWQKGNGPLLSNGQQLGATAKEIAKQPALELKRLAVLDPASAQYPLSFMKLRRMLRHLERNGFTSFAEA
jgi:5-methylcytosine-specific restriction enzyme B